MASSQRFRRQHNNVERTFGCAAPYTWSLDERSAILHGLRHYRYTLHRSWIGSGGLVNWIMLNPSTADDVFDDPTIRKCIVFSKRWGFSGLVVTNLFAYRATNPGELKMLPPTLAIGIDADASIVNEAAAARAVVCAWGDHGSWLSRDKTVIELLAGRELLCIGRTRNGNPLHPGRCAYTEAPIVFRPVERASDATGL